ncbi:LAME_0D02982g1_1 [Lachancea meyersii CBS 8951]|uniref:LAME_0D02982g1_1 n=1 Tax=Lachancea meyersii CBS 8951 TaxID=1266667 RepID=A0A1G4J7H0_9SACH|nr:LAME_0D02982g1_1 [Lachancea meyersii CBS 8951]
MERLDIAKGRDQESTAALLQNSALKPLFITSVTIDGDNKLSPLSDSIYKSVLEPVLSQPLQTLKQSTNNFTEIKRKLVYTGLFRDVRISLDKETSAARLEKLPEDAIKDYNLENPIPTAATILLSPIEFNKVSATSTTTDSVSAFGGRYSVINALGRAEVLTLQNELRFVPFKGAIDENTLETKLVVPLQQNPSVKAVVDASYAKVDLRGRTCVEPQNQTVQNHASVNLGVQKAWINNKFKCVPTFYSGLSVIARDFKDPTSVTGPDCPYIKNSLVSHLLFDNRKFFGLFPSSGVKLAINNEYVISQKLDKNSGSSDPSEGNFNKFALTLQGQRSFFKNRVVNSLDFACGGIIPTGQTPSRVHHIDKFYLGGMDSLKGFEKNAVGKYGGDFFYKLQLASSFKLPNTPADSPLRLQCFLNGGDVFAGKPSRFSYAASSGVSLLYKSSVANMDLTYALPITNRIQDATKPGFSFGVSLSLF